MMKSLVLQAKNITQLWYDGLDALLCYGDEAAPRGKATRELLGPTLTLTNPRHNLLASKRRKLSYPFSVAEFIWHLLGRSDVATIAPFNKRISQFSDDGVTFFGAYGPAIKAQLAYVVETLRRDPSSRQAVITLWKPCPPATKDVPCTTSLQFLIRDGQLHLHVYMRSNDVWLGFPYDVFNYTALQCYVADALLENVEVGWYRHTVGSFHIYEPDWQAAQEALAERGRNGLISRTLGRWGLMPTDLEENFELLARGAQTGSSVPVAGCWDEPWNTFMGVLAYKTHKNLEFVKEPYRTLILAGKDLVAAETV